MGLRGLLQELKRRRVYRATAVYVVAAAGVLQVADITIPALGLPSALMRDLVAGALAGLPIVVLVSWLFDVRVDRDSLRTPGRRSGRWRALGGLALVLVLASSSFYLVGWLLGRSSETDDGRSDPVALFNLGVEYFFSGDYQSAARTFERIAESAALDSTQRRDAALYHRDALRHIVRGYVSSGSTEEARVAMRKLLDLEPPFVLMHPSVETDNVMDLYYDVRREKVESVSASSRRNAVEVVEVFDLPFRVRDLPDSLGIPDLQSLRVGVAALLLTELMHQLPGMTFVDRRGLALRASRADEIYRYLEIEAAEAVLKPTHVVLGSVAGRGTDWLVSAWVFDARTGTLTHSAQVTSPLDQLFETMEELVRQLAAGMKQ